MKGCHCGKITAIGRVVIVIVNRVWLVQTLSVAIDHSIAQVNAVSGNSDDALHHVQARRYGREEDDDVSVAHVTVRHERTNVAGLGGGRETVNKNVVAYQQRWLDGAGWNGKCLKDKGDDKNPGNKYCDEAGNGLRKCFLPLFRFFVFRFRIQRLFPDVNSWALTHKMKGAAPPGFVEEMAQGVENVVAALSQCLVRIGIGWRIKRPKTKQRHAYTVRARTKTPLPAIQAGVAVIAHHEVIAIPDNPVIAVNILP